MPLCLKVSKQMQHSLGESLGGGGGGERGGNEGDSNAAAVGLCNSPVEMILLLLLL